MKLPQVQYTQTQSLGRHNLGAVNSKISAIQQKGQTEQRAMQAIAGVTADYIERQENAEFDTQISEYQIELAEWRSRHDAKQFYTADDIPEDIDDATVARVVTGTDDQGTQFSEIRNSIPAHEVYPHLLRRKLDGMIAEKASKISNPHLRKAFQEKAAADAETTMMRATVAAEQAQQKYTFDVGVNRATDASKNGNLAMAQFLIENLETDDLTKKKLLEAAEENVEIYEVTQAIRSSDEETVLLMRSILEDEEYAGALDESQRQAAIGDLNGRLAVLSSDRKRELTNAHESFISDANAGIDEGLFTLHDVEAGYARWKSNDTDPSGISGTERTALRARINARNARLKNKVDMAALGDGLITNGGNPKNSDHQKWIDAYVEEGQITDLRRLEEITIRSNIMPQVLEDFLGVAALHDAEKGSENIGVAVELYGRLADMKPEVLVEIGKEAKNVLADTHLMVRGNMPVDQAYELARENARVKPELREQRESDYRALKANDENPEILSDLMDEDDSLFGFEGGWRNVTVAEPNREMQIQFNAHTQMHYFRTGDIGLARKRAWSGIKESWSPSGVGGVLTGDGINRDARAMRYAPERVMAVSTEVAQQRLEAFARDQKLNPEHLTVTSDDFTARDGSWAIWVINPETDEIKIHPERWVGADWAEQARDHTYNERVEKVIADKAERDRVNTEMYNLSFGAQFDDLDKKGGN